jgi:flagellar L-ring protein precursor FlgH
MKSFTILSGVCIIGLLASASEAQSLFRRSTTPQVDTAGEPDHQAPARNASLFLVEAPKPKTFAIHDKVTIMISELSRQSASQKVDTKKNAGINAGVSQFPDLLSLLEARFEMESGSPIIGVEANADKKFKGDGKYERSDRFTDRITATVIDVKPNGVLVLEARRTIKKDDEVQTLVLSGECRREDITEQNTVMSNQLAELNLLVENEGQVRDASEKGFLTRIFDTVFNF